MGGRTKMKIQFIVTGWHFNQSSLIDGLYELKEDNKDTIDVFWSCHREPTNDIKEKFNFSRQIGIKFQSLIIKSSCKKKHTVSSSMLK